MERDVTSNMYPAAPMTTGSELCKVGVVAANTAPQTWPEWILNYAITEVQNWKLDKPSKMFIFIYSSYTIVYLKEKSEKLYGSSEINKE